MRHTFKLKYAAHMWHDVHDVCAWVHVWSLLIATSAGMEESFLALFVGASAAKESRVAWSFSRDAKPPERGHSMPQQTRWNKEEAKKERRRISNKVEPNEQNLDPHDTGLLCIPCDTSLESLWAVKAHPSASTATTHDRILSRRLPPLSGVLTLSSTSISWVKWRQQTCHNAAIKDCLRVNPTGHRKNLWFSWVPNRSPMPTIPMYHYVPYLYCNIILYHSISFYIPIIPYPLVPSCASSPSDFASTVSCWSSDSGGFVSGWATGAEALLSSSGGATAGRCSTLLRSQVDTSLINAKGLHKIWDERWGVCLVQWNTVHEVFFGLRYRQLESTNELFFKTNKTAVRTALSCPMILK